MRAGNRWTDSGLVFTTEFGGPVDPRNLLRVIEAAPPRRRLRRCRRAHAPALRWRGVAGSQGAYQGRRRPARTQLYQPHRR